MLSLQERLFRIWEEPDTKERVNFGCLPEQRCLDIRKTTKSAISEMYNFLSSKRKRAELKLWKMVPRSGTGCVLRMFTTLRTSGMCTPAAAATTTTRPIRMASAPASLSESRTKKKVAKHKYLAARPPVVKENNFGNCFIHTIYGYWRRSMCGICISG